MIIEETISKILQNGKFDGNKYFLPEERLEAKIYKKCNDVLESIGMKWNRGQKAHIGEGGDIEETFRAIIKSGEVETLKEYRDKYQFFPTPTELAEILIVMADIDPEHSVLEPSAGQGAILEQFPHYKYCLAIELDPKNFNILKDKYSQTKIGLLNEDFLEYNEGKFDRIVMNPPFTNSQDVKHILHAYSLLSEGGKLVSIASSSIQTRTGKLYDELKNLNPSFIEVPSQSFKTSGTMVNTVIVVLTK